MPSQLHGGKQFKQVQINFQKMKKSFLQKQVEEEEKENDKDFKDVCISNSAV